MPRHDVCAQRRMVVLFELRPVQGDHDLLACPDDEPRPRRRQLLDVDGSVAQEPIDLLDPEARLGPRHLRVGLADRVDRQGCGAKHTRHPVGQRLDTFDVQLVLEQLVNKLPSVEAIELGASLSGHAPGGLVRGHHATLNRPPRALIPRSSRLTQLVENTARNEGISQVRNASAHNPTLSESSPRTSAAYVGQAPRHADGLKRRDSTAVAPSRRSRAGCPNRFEAYRRGHARSASRWVDPDRCRSASW